MLNDVIVKNLKKKSKGYKVTDYAGLHVFVTPKENKLWRYRYQYGGREKLLGLGSYPAMSLTAARAARDAAKLLLDNGRDPAVEKKAKKEAGLAASANTFEVVARAWHKKKVPTWSAEHAENVIDSLENDIFPTLGNFAIDQIDAPMVLRAIRKIEQRGAIETAHRVRQRMSGVFVFGIASGLCSTDPAGVVAGAMTSFDKGQQPAITDLVEARSMLKLAEVQPAHPVSRLALRFLALTAVRNGEMRRAAWTEFEDLDGPAPLWRIPAERMKGTKKRKREHLVPLSRQAVEVLQQVRVFTGKGALVFPNTRCAKAPMSEGTLGELLDKAGYKGRHVPHGFRSTFSTNMNERFRGDEPVIELMLAHQKGDRVAAAYNRALHMERRRELAQIWADLLLEGANPLSALLVGMTRTRGNGARKARKVLSTDFALAA